MKRILLSPTYLNPVLRVYGCRAAILLPLLLLGACTPLTEQEKDYYDARKAEKDTLEAFGTKLATGAEQKAIIAQVQDHVNEEGKYQEHFEP